MYLWSIALLAGLTAPETTLTPASAVTLAASDLARLPVQIRPYIRYLSLYNVPEKKREDLIKVLSFLVNSLSRESELVSPILINNNLLRINAQDYKWDLGIWERFADFEPYFHLKIKFKEEITEKRYWPGGTYTDGKFYKAGMFTQTIKAGKTSVQHAPWLPTKDIAYLRENTYSEVPIVRGDWFLYQTAIQADRKAGYYDFLKLGKNQKDFENLIGADKTKASKVKKEIAAILARSGVTLQNRVIVRFGAITGGYWVTQDYKKSIDRSNVLRFLDKDVEPPQGDASEQYGFLPNGLFAFWLQNGQGVRQDFAPDFIASDGQAGGTDRRVHIGLSCIRCHIEGIRPINDYARRLYRGSIQLTSVDYKKFTRLRQLYLSDLDKYVKRDQLDYQEALFSVTKMKPAELAKAFARAWDDYAEVDLLPVDIARGLGVSEGKLINSIKTYAKTTGYLDPVIAGIIQKPPVEVRAEHLEEIYGQLQAITKGYIPK